MDHGEVDERPVGLPVRARWGRERLVRAVTHEQLKKCFESDQFNAMTCYCLALMVETELPAGCSCPGGIVTGLVEELLLSL